MITNTAPRPWYPGMPVKLNGLSTDSKPTEWGGKPVANGSEFKVLDADATYIFDAENATWHKWSQGSGGTPTDHIASDDDVDEALDLIFPTP